MPCCDVLLKAAEVLNAERQYFQHAANLKSSKALKQEGGAMAIYIYIIYSTSYIS